MYCSYAPLKFSGAAHTPRRYFYFDICIRKKIVRETKSSVETGQQVVTALGSGILNDQLGCLESDPRNVWFSQPSIALSQGLELILCIINVPSTSRADLTWIDSYESVPA